MCRPTPPTTLPTVILVCACARSCAVAHSKTAMAAKAAVRTTAHGISSRTPPFAGGFLKAYTSVRRRVELGRHVVHVLERRVEQRRASGTAPGRAAACPAPIAWRRSCPARRDSKISRNFSGGSSAPKVLWVSSQMMPASLSLSMPRCSFSEAKRAGLVVAIEHHAAGDGADELLHRVGMLVDELLAGPERAAGALDIIADPHQHLHAAAQAPSERSAPRPGSRRRRR